MFDKATSTTARISSLASSTVMTRREINDQLCSIYSLPTFTSNYDNSMRLGFNFSCRQHCLT